MISIFVLKYKYLIPLEMATRGIFIFFRRDMAYRKIVKIG